MTSELVCAPIAGLPSAKAYQVLYSPCNPFASHGDHSPSEVGHSKEPCESHSKEILSHGREALVRISPQCRLKKGVFHVSQVLFASRPSLRHLPGSRAHDAPACRPRPDAGIHRLIEWRCPR